MNILPFRGYRYGAPGAGGDVSSVVAPPYDQISLEVQARLHEMSPHNIVRITLPREEGDGDPYERACQVLEGWATAGTWRRDDEPAIYPYDQSYVVEGRRVTRRGFVALGEVSEYGEGVVHPHERTHSGPKRDRLRLLEATHADVGLLFMLVSDPNGRLLAAAGGTGDPIAEARDLRGETHRLWRVTDPVAIAGVQRIVAGRPAIIADGHHRYETAVEYARRHPRARHKLMAFFALEAPGLTILPNHRLVHHVEGFTLDGLAAAARPWFEVSPLADPLGFRPGHRSIGVVAGGEARVFRLRPEAFDRIAWPLGTSRAWRELAVSVLHEGLLRPLLDITDARLDARTHVDYTADQAEAVRTAGEGRCQAAFLIAATTPEELQAVVEGGELLPQKSTHFYPKLLDGLVFHRLEDA